MADASHIDVDANKDKDNIDIYLERNFRIIRDLFTLTDIHYVGEVGEVPFQNGWQNYGLGEQPCVYAKANNIIYIIGSLEGGTVAAAMFNLPIGYRPKYTQYVPTLAGKTAQQLGSIEVNANGDVIPDTSPSNTTWFVIPQISFFEEK